jgi:hypothetical protein
MICGALEALNTAICTENVVTKVSKFLADLAAYEADHQQPKDPRVPQIKGRTALVAVLVLLLFLVGFTYLLTSVLLTPRAINRLESIFFAVTWLLLATISGLRWYCARRR